MKPVHGIRPGYLLSIGSFEVCYAGGVMWWRKKAESSQHGVLRCSFCNKVQDDVQELIAGPNVFICNECVRTCNEVLADAKRFDREPSRNATERTRSRPRPLPNTFSALCVPSQFLATMASSSAPIAVSYAANVLRL
jgi:ClpX C4-type zinc finger protein